MQGLIIDTCVLDAKTEGLRQEVRDFLARELPPRTTKERFRNKGGADAAFSRKLGQQGWIGMSIPKAYGGHERSPLERYVVTEELLAASAPVSAHWIADRQYGPVLMHYGTEEIKRDFLPRIARGELFICVGLSEPDSGSDLASIRTKGERTQGGWIINGRKVWNSASQWSHYVVALVRTGQGEKRQAGLSQFVIDLKAPGVTLRPVHILTGEHRWNEIIFDNVFVPDTHLLGQEGQGWAQVTTELGFERAGPDRYLSSLFLLLEMLDAADPDNPHHAALMGSLVADIATVRQMSLGIAGMMARGESAGLAASLVKELGNTLEQRIPEVAHELFDMDIATRDTTLAEVAAYLTQTSPTFSLRGGTREILRGIIARGLGVR